jgi:hypothetical protein
MLGADRFLHEHEGRERWLPAVMVSLGVAVVAFVLALLFEIATVATTPPRLIYLAV